jgi:hypothetical protein
MERMVQSVLARIAAIFGEGLERRVSSVSKLRMRLCRGACEQVVVGRKKGKMVVSSFSFGSVFLPMIASASVYPLGTGVETNSLA